ncbi:MAG: cyclodeaminase/cyclohydrolase family protein [Anaerolineae bacterium]|nr:cyclodeaminase/cyclohydrolase family protein [Anaerolineae bacterium]
MGKTIGQFVAEVSDQHHPMTGVVVAVAAAQAAALGEACMQISFDNQVDKLDWQDVTKRIARMAQLKEGLLERCELETRATIGRAALENAAAPAHDQQFCCESSTEISRLAVKAATLLQDFRPLAFKSVRDDLEITIHLLACTARTALLLLDSYLHTWSNPKLRAEYEPSRNEVENQLKLIRPVTSFENK